MGNREENRAALEDVLGSAMPLHVGADHPSVPLEKMREPMEVHSILDTDIATPTRQEWQGYELHLLHTSTSGVRVAVAFEGSYTGAYELRPGDGLRVPRGFGHVFLDSVGSAGTFEFLVVRVPFVEPLGRTAVWSPDPLDVSGATVPVSSPAALNVSAATVNVSSPTNTPLNVAGPVGTWISAKLTAPAAGALLLDTGALAAGDYEAEFWSLNETGSQKAVYAQHRDAANAATLSEQVGGALSGTSQVIITLPRLAVALNERFRLLLGPGAVAGILSCSIYYRRVA